MGEITGTYFAVGDKLHPASGFNAGLFEQGYSVYEVVRIINGKVLFLTEHLERLLESVRLSYLDYVCDSACVTSAIKDLVSACRIPVGNIKIVVHFPPAGQPATYTYFIPHAYPTSEDYRMGVRTILLRSVRREPNIKSLTSQQKLPSGNQEAPNDQIYEKLLVDPQGHITEGSKSNVFFIKGDHLQTAPDDMVLKGITRQKVISIIKSLNYDLITSPVSTNDLEDMDTAFLTGTSPKVLPISTIGQSSLDAGHPMLRQIMQAFDRMIDKALSDSTG